MQVFFDSIRAGDLPSVISAVKHDPLVVHFRFGGETALVAAVKAGSIGIAEALLDAGAEIDAVTDAGETALMVASMIQSELFYNMLCKRGADAERAWQLVIFQMDNVDANPSAFPNRWKLKGREMFLLAKR
jgi:hypothetical protein